MQTQEVAIKPSLKIFLKSDSQMIDEVMVVAYGTAKKSSFTGSASTVKADKLAERSVSNVTNALAGQVSGVQTIANNGQPGSAATVRIRGIGSMSASNSPLYVVDGIPFDGSISSINPQDIESMTVLKDAAANAIYGARGANGVILITTKKGDSKEAVITVDAKWGSNRRAVPTYDVMTDPGMYYETMYRALYNSKAYNGSSMTEAYAFADAALLDDKNGGVGYLVYTVPEGEKLIGTNFKLNPNATLGYSDGKYYYRPDDWYDEAFGNSNLRQEYNVSVAGASDKINYYMSAGYLDDSGIVPGSGFTRFTGRAKADYQAKKWLKVGANIGYTYYNIQSPSGQTTWGSSGNLFQLTNMIAPIYPVYVRNPDGNIQVDERGLTVYDFGSSTNFVRPSMSGNPLGTMDLDKQNAYTDVINSKWYAILTPIEGLSITANIGANVRNQRSNELSNPFYGSSVSSGGAVYVAHYREFAINQQYLATYKKTFANLHNFDVLAGYESYNLKIQELQGSNTKIYNPTIGELSNAIASPPKVVSFTDEYTTMGFLGRIQYDYDGKYFLSASYRRDASSRFHPDNRWGNFWSASAAWNISHEEWFDIDWVDMLKFKVSYGSQGNDKIGDYRYVNTYNIVNSSGNPAAVPNTLGNKDITWETNANFNVGFDFELFKRRLTGTIEFFNRKTTDMLFSFPLPPSFGYTSYYANVGDMRNLGLEAEFKGTILKTRDLQWDLGLNLTHYRNKITYLPEERKTMEVDGVKGYSSGNKYYGEGESLYTFYTYKYAGVNEEGEALYYRNVKDENGNVIGKETVTNPSEADFYLCGTALPDVYGGFNTSLSYKGFDFSVDFAYQIGGQVYDSDYAMMMSSPTAQNKGKAIHKDMFDAWTAENTSSNIPRFQYGDEYSAEASDRFLTSASYLSLQNINVGYTLPANICRTFGVEKLRVYMAADNVYLWSKRKGMDPRQSISGSTTASFYAPMRTISGGITLTF